MSAAVAADVDRIKPTTIRLMNIFVYLSMVICVCCEFILLVAGVFSFLVALSLAFYSSSRDYQSDLIVCLIFMCTSFSLQLINFMRKMCVCVYWVCSIHASWVQNVIHVDLCAISSNSD